MDSDRIKKDFPIFQTNPGLIYFDNAATSQKPKSVIDKVSDFYKTYNSNVHRGIYSLAEEATQEYENARQKLADFINCSSEEVIFTRGSTEGLNLAAYTLSKSKLLEKGDNIVTTIMEHHSNFVPWQQICIEKGLEFKVVPITKNYQMDWL